MGRHNLPPPIDHQEQPVKLSRSFADAERKDVSIIWHGQTNRVITYPTPSEESLRLRQALADRRLVLGRKVDDRRKPVAGRSLEHFVIPDSARPMARDKRLNRDGFYNHDDQQLFFGLGRLLGLVAREGAELPLVLRGAIGSNVALAIDDNDPSGRKVGEPAILLVPGFERKVGVVKDDDAVLEFYDNGLFDEFSLWFEASQERFTEGFRTTLGR